MAPNFSDAPDEVILSIFGQLSTESLLASGRTCRRFYRLAAEPVLWRKACMLNFKFWNEPETMRMKFSDPLPAHDWKSIFVSRYKKSRLVLRLLNSILSEQPGRIAKFHDIAALGYEAKDELVYQISLHDQVEDGLCRSYYSRAVLSHIQRSIGISVWKQVMQSEIDQYELLERALASFDMFILGEGESDLDQISRNLDELAVTFTQNAKKLHEMSVREKALGLATFLRAQGFQGIPKDIHFHDLRHNYLGQALQDKSHSCLPLVDVVIYCAIARRLGVDARLCAFPFHAHAVVYSPSGMTLDSIADDIRPGTASKCMYLNPFRTDKEIPVRGLVAQLESLGTNASDISPFLSACSVAELIKRGARNIAKSVKVINEKLTYHGAMLQMTMTGAQMTTDGAQVIMDGTHMTIDGVPNRSDALYGAIWANCILNEPWRREEYLSYLVNEMSTHFPGDISLIEEYINTMDDSEEISRLRIAIQAIRSTDRMTKEINRRSEVDKEHAISYKIGQVFVHKRYRYLAVITGWDRYCKADEEWIRRMGVDSLPNGRNQSFYNVLSWDNEVRYVAEENIQIETPEWPESLMKIAGKYFKRWDKASRTFISNIKDEYPED